MSFREPIRVTVTFGRDEAGQVKRDAESVITSGCCCPDSELLIKAAAELIFMAAYRSNDVSIDYCLMNVAWKATERMKQMESGANEKGVTQ